ncbi:DUF1403 family protein [Mesorhizobium sp. LSJC269B00]|nr:DUF1403 family protein [Mesorhizobium sp. LSJC269B00]
MARRARSVGTIELSADLGRRAERLLAVAPKLRAKGADHGPPLLSRRRTV